MDLQKKNTLSGSLILLLAAVIWGTAFVAQSAGGEVMGAFTFNSIRFFIGYMVLLPVIAFLKRKGFYSPMSQRKTDKKQLQLAGLCCGTALFVASNLQQYSFTLGSTAGNAGFLTACYIIIVPVLGVFMKKKCPVNVWIGVILAIAGLYFICIDGEFVLQGSDVCLLLCALCYSVHIILVDYFSQKVDSVRLSCNQFLVSAVLTTVLMITVDMKSSVSGVKEVLSSLMTINAWIPILYAGIMSCGVAYTLQIVGQKKVKPALASILMSLEAVFSVIAGSIFLNEKMSGRELAGCALLFAAVILAQMQVRTPKRFRTTEIVKS